MFLMVSYLTLLKINQEKSLTLDADKDDSLNTVANAD